MKIDLVYLPEYKSAFLADYIEPEIKKYFDIYCYDSNKTYDRNKTIFLTQPGLDISLTEILQTDNYKIAIENLWEYPAEQSNKHVIKSERWFWINECLWLYPLGNRDYQINKTFKKLAFMPIGRKKSFRDRVLEKLQPYLDDFIWSYNVRQSLPEDCDHSSSKTIEWQRFFNPSWYNDTHFSVVIETMTDGFFVTEKTFKPLAYKHPFLVIGTAKTLRALKDWGFETFDNLFDETYDRLSIFDQRLDLVIENIKSYKKDFYSPLTLKKLKHNSDHFWDLSRVRELFYADIVEPLLHYANRET